MPTSTPTGDRLPGRPIVYGEVLFDCFEDGSSVLGGAPFNVAWHLQGFGLAPLFVSRVGEDALGEKVLEAMAGWGMATDGVQRDPDYPTGQVTVALTNGQPRFDIRANQAYDHIQMEPVLQLFAAEAPSLLYHGTLIARSPRSAATLNALRDPAHNVPVFVDVNLRPPWWQHSDLEEGLRMARWAKLNDEELAALLEVSPESLHDAASIRESAAEARNRFELEMLVVTRGADGAVLLSRHGIWNAPAAPVEKLVDTVGAGDAFSAVTLLGLMNGWPPREILMRALQFASALCSQRGATAADPDLYARHLEAWQT